MLWPWRECGLEWDVLASTLWQCIRAWDAKSYDGRQSSDPACCGWVLGDEAVAGDGYCALSHRVMAASP